MILKYIGKCKQYKPAFRYYHDAIVKVIIDSATSSLNMHNKRETWVDKYFFQE